MAIEQCRYNNATKATWRGWAWNQIAARVSRGSTVMVLCGDTAADEESARKRGLYCVGVDMSADCAQNFRKDGGISIHGDALLSMLQLKPDAVILDFHGGLSLSNAVLVKNTTCCKAVCVNLLRGRDSYATKFRHWSDIAVREGRVREKIGIHRGRLAFAVHAYLWMYESANNAQDYDRLDFIEESFNNPGNLLNSYVDYFASNIKSYSYRSKDGGQVFDSSCWTNATAMVDGGTTWFKSQKKVAANKRKVSNAKSLLTMRKKKVLDKYKPFGMN